MTSSLYTVLKIDEIIQETDDFKRFIFSPNDIQYKAGQYLTLLHPDARSQTRRSYSITSCPELGERLAIGVKRISNGVFSRRLVDYAREGDLLVCAGAGGFFLLPENPAENSTLFFFAAGAGITPIFSLIKSALRNAAYSQIVLVYSNASREKTIFYNELIKLEKENYKRLKIHFLFSDSKNLTIARLDGEQIRKFISQGSRSENTIFYTCGPAAYMRMISFVLMEAGIMASAIRKEDFLPVRTHAALPEPPDRNKYSVKLFYKKQSYQFAVQYPTSILRAASNQNIDLPFSCEVGKCGNCVAKVLSGNVWMSNNEVLMDAELEKGLVLTCVGFPVKGDLIISMGS